MAVSRKEMEIKLTKEYQNKRQQECVVLAVWDDNLEFYIHAYNPVWGDFEIIKQTYTLKVHEKSLKPGTKILCTRIVTANNDAKYTLDSNLDHENLKTEFNAYYNTKMRSAIYNKINEKIYSI